MAEPIACASRAGVAPPALRASMYQTVRAAAFDARPVHCASFRWDQRLTLFYAGPGRAHRRLRLVALQQNILRPRQLPRIGTFRVCHWIVEAEVEAETGL